MPTSSRPRILNSTCPPPPALVGCISERSLSRGAITSGLLLAPAYSPIRESVGPYTIPPSAKALTFGMEVREAMMLAILTAAIMGPTTGIPACDLPASEADTATLALKSDRRLGRASLMTLATLAPHSSHAPAACSIELSVISPRLPIIPPMVPARLAMLPTDFCTPATYRSHSLRALSRLFFVALYSVSGAFLTAPETSSLASHFLASSCCCFLSRPKRSLLLATLPALSSVSPMPTRLLALLSIAIISLSLSRIC